MNLIDTNGISHVLESNITVSDIYYMAPDVKEESEMTELIHGKVIPDEISELSSSDFFSNLKYLAHYKMMLNKHRDRSFFNMTGFGDISMLAAIHTVLEIFEERKRQELFDPTEEIIVFTKDTGLSKKISSEFVGHLVTVKNITEIT